jgi:mitochondrial fusion and transport protein UGO1
MSSLRDSYSVQTPSWSFDPPKQPANGSASLTPTAPRQWSTKPAHNSIFDLSPDLNHATDGIDVVNLLRALVASAVLQYTSTAIAMPWEVGKLLLQVQWIPRDVPDLETPAEDEEEPVCVTVPLLRRSF